MLSDFDAAVFSPGPASKQIGEKTHRPVRMATHVRQIQIDNGVEPGDLDAVPGQRTRGW